MLFVVEIQSSQIIWLQIRTDFVEASELQLLGELCKNGLW